MNINRIYSLINDLEDNISDLKDCIEEDMCNLCITITTDILLLSPGYGRPDIKVCRSCYDKLGPKNE